MVPVDGNLSLSDGAVGQRLNIRCKRDTSRFRSHV